MSKKLSVAVQVRIRYPAHRNPSRKELLSALRHMFDVAQADAAATLATRMENPEAPLVADFEIGAIKIVQPST
jgi:hypothetical protein